MKLSVQPVQISDTKHLAEIAHDAFSPSILHQAIFTCSREEYIEWTQRDLENTLNKGRDTLDTRIMLFKVIDEDEGGKNVGYAKWEVPREDTVILEDSELQRPKQINRKERGFPNGCNLEIGETFFQDLASRRKVYYNPKTDYC
jgi:hypothetical protein